MIAAGAAGGTRTEEVPEALRLRVQILDLRHRVAELEANLRFALLERDQLRQQAVILAAAQRESAALELERQIIAENLVFGAGGDPHIDRWDLSTKTLRVLRTGGRETR